MNNVQAKNIIEKEKLWESSERTRTAFDIAIKALENQRNCEECAGCTSWKCDCANIRDKVIDDFVDKVDDMLGASDRDIYCKEVIRDIAEQIKKTNDLAK